MLYFNREAGDELRIDLANFSRGLHGNTIRIVVERVSNSGIVRLGVGGDPVLRIFRGSSEGSMGRKKMTAEKVDIRLRVDAKLEKQIRSAAEKDFTTVAAFVRAAVVKELKRREAEAKG